MNLSDTIVAIATPAGRGGIGIVRISGSESIRIAGRLVTTGAPLQSWSPVRGSLRDETHAVIDDVLITFFQRPRSYTAEDVVEIACHGAPIVLRKAVEMALRYGARLAEPGEFTLRAYVHGRIDLPQAEAVHDLIEATTLHQARIAAEHAGGALSRELTPLKAQLIDLIALLEAGIDFAEDDVSVATKQQLRERFGPLQAGVERLAHSFEFGRVVREGFSLTIIGRPNVGKSSLFNRMLEQDRAIVTDTPGTTRDLISEVTAIHGIPVRLSDTAGIRDGESLVEILGIERSWQSMADADLSLVVVDANVPMGPRDEELVARARAQGRFLLVANKCDTGSLIPDHALAVSALTGQGIDRLRTAILEHAAPGGIGELSGVIITNLRQAQALRDAAAALDQARKAIEEEVPHEMLLLDLYGALERLDNLTGKTTADEILNRIFATFCIGK